MTNKVKGYYLLRLNDLKRKLPKPIKDLFRDDKGEGLISFLMVFGVWIMIMFTFISMFFLQILQGSMSNAVNLGLEKAAIVGGTTTEVKNLIIAQLAHSGVPTSSFVITGSGNDVTKIVYGNYITITVTGPRNYTDWSGAHPTAKTTNITVTKTIMSQYYP